MDQSLLLSDEGTSEETHSPSSSEKSIVVEEEDEVTDLQADPQAKPPTDAHDNKEDEAAYPQADPPAKPQADPQAKPPIDPSEEEGEEQENEDPGDGEGAEQGNEISDISSAEQNLSQYIPKKKNKRQKKSTTGFQQYTIPQLLGLIQAYNQKKTCNIEKYYKPLNKVTLIEKIEKFMEIKEEGNEPNNITIKSTKPESMTFDFSAVQVDSPNTRKAKKAAKKKTTRKVSKSTQQELKRIKKSYTEYKQTSSPSTDTEADNLFKAHQERVAKHRNKLRERTAAATAAPAPAPKSPSQSPASALRSPSQSPASAPKAPSPKAARTKQVRIRTTPLQSTRTLRSASIRHKRRGGKKTRTRSSRR